MVHLDSVSSQDAGQKFWLIDKHGLITDQLRERGLVREGLDDFIHFASEFSSAHQTSSSTDKKSEQGSETTEIGLLDVVKHVKPTVLIGCSTNARGFTEEVVRAMKKHCERPIIFPLSNPSKLVEVDPKDANNWTDGMALIATGSPFPPVKGLKGKDYMFVTRHSNLYLRF
jgi:malate dehydrogenase (oxaloacetate-decarboxylating)